MSDKSKPKQSGKELAEDKPATSNADLSGLASLTSPLNLQDMMGQIDARIKESEQVISQSLASTFALLSQAADHLTQATQHTSQSAQQQNQEVADITSHQLLQSDSGKQYHDAMQSMQAAEQQVANAMSVNANQTGVTYAMDAARQGIQQAEDKIHQGIQASDNAISNAIHQQHQAVSQLQGDPEKTVADAINGASQETSVESQQSST